MSQPPFTEPAGPSSDGDAIAFLVQTGVLPRGQGERLLERALACGRSALDLALEGEFVTQAELDGARSRYTLYRFAAPPEEVASLVPAGWARHRNALPLSVDKGLLEIGVTNPSPEAQRRIGAEATWLTGLSCRTRLVQEEDLARALRALPPSSPCPYPRWEGLALEAHRAGQQQVRAKLEEDSWLWPCGEMPSWCFLPLQEQLSKELAPVAGDLEMALDAREAYLAGTRRLLISIEIPSVARDGSTFEVRLKSTAVSVPVSVSGPALHSETLPLEMILRDAVWPEASVLLTVNDDHRDGTLLPVRIGNTHLSAPSVHQVSGYPFDQVIYTAGSLSYRSVWSDLSYALALGHRTILYDLVPLGRGERSYANAVLACREFLRSHPQVQRLTLLSSSPPISEWMRILDRVGPIPESARAHVPEQARELIDAGTPSYQANRIVGNLRSLDDERLCEMVLREHVRFTVHGDFYFRPRSAGRISYSDYVRQVDAYSVPDPADYLRVTKRRLTFLYSLPSTEAWKRALDRCRTVPHELLSASELPEFAVPAYVKMPQDQAPAALTEAQIARARQALTFYRQDPAAAHGFVCSKGDWP